MSGSKKLDELFKKKLGNRKVPYDDSSWQKMSALLDESMPVGAAAAAHSKAELLKRSAFKVAIAAGIVAFIGAWWWASPNDKPDFEVEKGDIVTQTSGAKEAVPDAIQSESSELVPQGQSGKAFSASELNTAQDETTEPELKDPALRDNTSSTSVLAADRQVNTVENIRNTASGAIVENGKELNFKSGQTAEMIDSPSSPNLLDDETNSFDVLERQKMSGIQMLKISESTPMQLAKADDRPIELPKVYTHLFNILAGANIAKDYNTSGASFSGNEFIGLSYEILMPSNFGFGAQLIYQARKGVNTSNTFEYVDYSFGKETHLTTIENNRLYYLELPLFASYRIKKSRLHAGISTSYLLTSKAVVRNEVYGQTRHSVSTEEELGHTSGLSNLDFALLAGYEFAVRPRLALGLTISYGLLDVTDNDYFESDARNTNSQLRLSLKYNLATR